MIETKITTSKSELIIPYSTSPTTPKIDSKLVQSCNLSLIFQEKPSQPAEIISSPPLRSIIFMKN